MSENNVIKLEGTKLKGITRNERGFLSMEYTLADTWTTGDNAMERSIPLYVTKYQSQELDPEAVERLQTGFRKSLHDDNINFNVPANPDDPNDLENWIKAHPNADIEMEARSKQDGSTYHIVANQPARQSSSNATGHANNYLQKYKGVGEYDPKTQFMGLFDAQTDTIKTQLSAKSGPDIQENKSRSGRTYMNLNKVQGRIVNKIITTTKPYGVTTQPKNLNFEETIDAFVALLGNFNDPKGIELQDQLKALKTQENAGIHDLFEILGGVNAYNVPEIMRDAVEKEWIKINTSVMTFYIETEAHKVFQLSPNSLRKNRSNLHVEFLVGDFKTSDILKPIIKSGLVEDQVGRDAAEKLGFFKEGQGIVFENANDASDWLNEVFNGKGIIYNITNVNSDDTQKLGAQIQSISLDPLTFDANPTSEATETVTETQTTPTATETVTETTQEPTSPFTTEESHSEEDNQAVQNPFD